ncbi:aminotransferase class I/II-fold pyridoxal phosphate-dependent enzyme [Oceanibaculum pacificum]|uniref:Aminotransferase class I/classII large domain-containing protein n=1 Tax=Oceanibaculum pacificum TaxID=580166 RepID=A0A154W875_9PROT|nr:aminotransferase class I/II-fold pyridoxal phosphate-dependent enzyme [Oceanibaculum pacificum]KZD09739.1 hypothetical protein AUP43_06730 [Oceanibaculum pacificum]
MKAATQEKPALRTDRFGNVVDPTVGYARGAILTGELAESLRQQRAYGIVRERYARLGDAGIFNLTGLIRAFPLEDSDDEAMRSYVHFIARSQNELESLALARMGGGVETHAGFLATRITAGMLAVMLTLLKPGDRVLSLVADDRSHPSVRQAVVLAGGRFEEFTDPDAYAEAIATGDAPRMAVFTAISPSKKHLVQPIVEKAAALAKAKGALIVIDDAHMAARISLYDESPGLALAGADIAVWSLDKHLGGPRSGFVAGKQALIAPIKARALALGVEAQLGQYLAAVHAVERFDPEPIRAAARMSETILEALRPELGDKVYLAGAGIAVGGEDMLELAMRRSNMQASALVPIEAVAYASMRVLAEHGGVMIPAVGMPGAACTFRIMMYPDGMRMGEQRILAAWRTAIDGLSAALDDRAQVAAWLQS